MPLSPTPARLRWAWMLAFLILPFVTGCPSPVVQERSPEPAWADSVLASLSVEEKVGQLLMIDLPVSGRISDEAIRLQIQERLRKSGAGGVVLFAADPIESAETVAWAQYAGRLPLFVALDAEWGAGYRLDGLTRFPDAMAIGATGDPALARKVGAMTAREAASVGVNVLFAPTVDVNVHPANPVIGTRAWSDDPDSVAQYAGAFVEGVSGAGLLPVLKHFPGHGGTTRDSHLDLPVAEANDEEFQSVHVAPFRQILSGTGGTDFRAAVMTAHIVPEGHLFADSVAATFSHRILSDLLRDSLAYNGLVFTDALNMAGAASGGSPGERAIRALEAGADVLLMPTDIDDTRRAIVEAIRSGRLTEERIDASVSRILEEKQRLGLTGRPASALPPDLFDAITRTDNRQEAHFMARSAVTVLKDETVMPLAVDESVLLISVDHRTRNRGTGGPASLFKGELEDRSGHSVQHIEVDPRAWAASIPAIRTASRSHEAVVVADYTGNTPVFGWSPVSFLRDVSSTASTLALVSFDKPYALPDVADVPDVIIQSYDSSPAMASGTADILYGLAPASGRLPVNVPPTWQRGSGLRLPAQYAAIGRAEESGLDATSLAKLDVLLDRAVADSAFPTAAVAVGHDLVIGYQDLVGYHTFDRTNPVQERDLFDLASLTKVISTTSAVMLLVEQGRIDLDRPVADYLPAFGQNGKGMVTVRQLLTHTGGLIPFRPFHMQGVRSGAEVRRRILSDTLAYEPGNQSRYSDFGPITLAWMIEAITGRDFADFVREEVFTPLAMVDTGYLSSRTRNRPDAVPTESDDYFRFRTLQGEVHDETAWLLGGTAGHAGLFSTIRDLGRFAGMLSRDGRIGDKVFLRPETLRHFTTAVDPQGYHTRALGWDTKSMTGYSSAGSRFGPRSFGHTGFTGTSFWYDPDSHLFVILLTNRVYPTRDNRKHIPIRPAVADAAFDALATGLARQAAPTE